MGILSGLTQKNGMILVRVCPSKEVGCPSYFYIAHHVDVVTTQLDLAMGALRGCEQSLLKSRIKEKTHVSVFSSEMRQFKAAINGLALVL